jgi:hypothetical protein
MGEIPMAGDAAELQAEVNTVVRSCAAYCSESGQIGFVAAGATAAAGVEEIGRA